VQTSPDPDPRANLRLALAAAGVFALALALRLLHLDALRDAWEGTRLFSLARGDAAHHWREAQDILDGDPWLRDRVFWKGPLYSYLLAGLMDLVGREPAALRWPFAWLGALNCAGLVVLARRLLPLRWAAVAGVLAAVNGIVLLYDTELFFPPVLITLSLGAMLFLGRERTGWPAAAGAGALLGLAALTHPVYLLPAAALALGRLRRQPAAAAALVLATGLVVAPATLHNLVAQGEPVLISWSGGVNLYIGNQPGFDQTSGQGTAAWARVLQTPRDAGLESESNIDRTYLRLTGAQLARDPLGALRILAHKVLLLASPLEIANNIRLYELRDLSPVLRATLGRFGPLAWPFGLWFPLAAVGAWRLRRAGGDAGATHAAVAWWTLGLALSMVLAFQTARYRAPVVFLGTIWVAAALRDLGVGLRMSDRRAWVRNLGVVGGLAVLLAVLTPTQRTLPPPWRFAQAQVAEGERRPAEALRWLEAALDRNPDDPLLALEAASMLDRAGQPDRADTLRAGVVARTGLEPDLRALALERQAQAHRDRGDRAAAAAATRLALELEVDDTTWRGHPYFAMDLVPSTACRLRLWLAGIELERGRRAEARSLVERVRSDCPDGDAVRLRLRELDLRLR